MTRSWGAGGMRFAVCACVALFALSAPGIASQALSADQATRDSMPVKVANRTVIILRGPLAGHTASERAKASVERIERVLKAEPAPQITFEDIEDGKATKLMLGGKFAFVVSPLEIDVNAGETTQIIAREAAKRLEQAIAGRREQRTPLYFAIATGFAAAATLLYGAILWLIVRGNRWIGGRLSAAAAARSEKVHVRGVRLFDAAQVLLLTRRAFLLLAWILALALASGWITFVLEQYHFTRPWGEELGDNILELLKQVALAMAEATPGLLLVVIIFVVARWIVRMAAVFSDRVEKGRVVKWLDADTVEPTRRIFNFAVLVFALAMAYPYLPGADTEAFKGLSVLVGLMVSLGGASVIGQAFNGLILMYTRVYRIGEYVRVGENEGTVTGLGMFTTCIRTGMGEEVTLPNSSVMGGSIRNYSRAVPGTGCVVDTVVTIGYSTPWRQVEAMLLEAARRTVDIVSAPAPIVRQTALSDFYIQYRLAAYTPAESPTRRIDVLNQLHGHIQDVFNEYGVQIMSPHYMMDPKEPQVVPKGDWHAAPARPSDAQGHD